MRWNPDDRSEDELLDEIMRLDLDALPPVSQAERFKAGLAFARAAYKPSRATLTLFTRAAYRRPRNKKSKKK